MGAPKPVRLDLVMAHWCPHCDPVSTERAPRLAQKLGVPLRLLDIDVAEQEAEADRMVHDHGDWDPNYLIPQVFVEWDDGRVTHLLTGVPGTIEGTARLWQRLLDEPEPTRGRTRAGGAPDGSS